MISIISLIQAIFKKKNIVPQVTLFRLHKNFNCLRLSENNFKSILEKYFCYYLFALCSYEFKNTLMYLFKKKGLADLEFVLLHLTN